MRKARNKTQGVLLQKRNNRWKWMAGATAATAAGVTASQANTITINLVNNYISAIGGNHLNADLTGDGHPDLTIANAHRGDFGRSRRAGVTLNGVQAFGGSHFYDTGTPISKFDSMRLGSRSAYYRVRINRYLGTTTRYGTPSLMGSIPIFFKDLHTNGGAPTEGFLEVTVSGAHIYLDSFTYNSNTPTPAQTLSHTVPDQGSSLALLAMGAGGILAFRRWRATQERP